jgi:hypothetical protein
MGLYPLTRPISIYLCTFSQIEGHGFRALKDGQKVILELVDGAKGPQADKVRVEEWWSRVILMQAMS